MILLKEYIKNKISELEGTKVQEKKAKSKILVQHYFKISKTELLFNDLGLMVEITDPKIYGALIALIVGFFSKNVIATILSGLLSYWFIIFLI